MIELFLFFLSDPVKSPSDLTDPMILINDYGGVLEVSFSDILIWSEHIHNKVLNIIPVLETPEVVG